MPVRSQPAALVALRSDWPDIIAGKRLVTTGNPISTSFVQALTARPAIQPVSVELMLFESSPFTTWDPASRAKKASQ